MDVTAFTMGPSDDAELTMQEAARLLGISPAYLDRLVEEGHVCAHLVAAERRLKASDVMTHRPGSCERRLAQVAAISHADSELGIPY